MSERASPDSRSIAVLIPVFNDDGQLDATLRSIDDPRVPVVVVIVDDGSETPVVVRHPSHQEIVVLRHDVNRGIENALNTGLAYIVQRGIPYVARLANGDRAGPRTPPPSTTEIAARLAGSRPSVTSSNRTPASIWWAPP